MFKLEKLANNPSIAVVDYETPCGAIMNCGTLYDYNGPNPVFVLSLAYDDSGYKISAHGMMAIIRLMIADDDCGYNGD